MWENAQTYVCGQCLLRDHFECVNNRDVAKPPGDGQSAVPILEVKMKMVSVRQ